MPLLMEGSSDGREKKTSSKRTQCVLDEIICRLTEVDIVHVFNRFNVIECNGNRSKACRILKLFY